jgi:hypothetical protein
VAKLVIIFRNFSGSSKKNLSQYRDGKPVAAEREAECVNWRFRFFVSNVLELVSRCPKVICARLA